MPTSSRPDPNAPDHAHDPAVEGVAKPRFWGPASYWRLGLVALLVVIVLLAIFGT